MKTINVTRVIIIALLVGFISTFSSYASSPAAVSAKNIREKFVNAVMNPDDQTNVPTTGEVEVLFTVYIKKLKASNDDAAKYVKDKIELLTLNDFVHPYNQVYKIKFKFEQD